jgi:hypothetical protein
MPYIKVQKAATVSGVSGTFAHIAEALDNAQNVVAPVVSASIAGPQTPSDIVSNPLGKQPHYGLANASVSQAGSNFVGGQNRA